MVEVLDQAELRDEWMGRPHRGRLTEAAWRVKTGKARRILQSSPAGRA
jgi:uncharacterized protein YndB with AHSA1/START domain